VAIMRELAGIRVQVPSNRNFPVQKMDQLRQRVYELAVALVEGGTSTPDRLPARTCNLRHKGGNSHVAWPGG
jgi:hypothetical protein